MNAEMQALLKAERKYRRELAELRAARQRHAGMVQPDARVLKMIDDEIAMYLGKKK